MRSLFAVILLIFLTTSVLGQDVVWSDPMPVPGINTGSTDYYPSISSDGNKLYFTSYREGNEDIYVSERINGEWSTPVNLGPPVNSEHRDLAPSISSDGNTLYFISYGREGGYGSYDIWYSEWDSITQSWGEPINPGPNVNSFAGEWSPCISHDGTKLYFASADYTRPGHLGSDDLYVSEMGENGWMPAVNLGINSFGDDYCPSISHNDSVLYFASNDPHDVECWHNSSKDLFVAYFINGHWGNLQNVCDPVCSEAWERSPSISYSGDTLYFARKHTGEGDSIYYSVSTATSIEDDMNFLPKNTESLNSYPNPFNTTTRISYQNLIHAEIQIYDITGRLVKTIAIGNNASGHVAWDATDSSGEPVSTGVYFAQAVSEDGVASAKVVYLK